MQEVGLLLWSYIPVSLCTEGYMSSVSFRTQGLVETQGMKWENLSDSFNGMKEVLIIMFGEWLLVLPIAYFVDQAMSPGSSVNKSILFCLSNLMNKSSRFL